MDKLRQLLNQIDREKMIRWGKYGLVVFALFELFQLAIGIVMGTWVALKFHGLI